MNLLILPAHIKTSKSRMLLSLRLPGSESGIKCCSLFVYLTFQPHQLSALVDHQERVSR